LAQGMEGFCKELSGKELVHTSYFDHSAVMELISCNITWSMGEEMVKWKTWRMDPELARWFGDAKQSLRNDSQSGSVSTVERERAHGRAA